MPWQTLPQAPLSLLALVAVAFAAIATFGVRSRSFANFVQAIRGKFTILVTLWVATALLYPLLRRSTAWFVDAVVLHRPDYRSLRATVAQAAQDSDDVEPLLSAAGQLL